MSSAVFALIVNTAIAALFSSTFAAIGFAKGAPRSARWFAAAYAVGMLTPLSEIGLRLNVLPAVLIFTSFATFVLAFLVTGFALAQHYDRPFPWSAAMTIATISLCLRAAIWGGPRNTMPYELLYQLPFALAVLLCWWIVHRASEQSRSRQVLSFAFLFVALHFIFKSQAAVIVGSGETAQAYAGSAYALISQSVTGILLTAIGLLLLFLVFGRMLAVARSASEIDVLSGLLNRRGFESAAQLVFERSFATRFSIALILFDLDHFKSINDRYGHSTGDEVIRRFGSILRQNHTPQMISARIGGEEFAVLIENCDAAMANLFAESVRSHLDSPSSLGFQSQTSAGLAVSVKAHNVHVLLAQADIALYRAKRAGRNRVQIFTDEGEPARQMAMTAASTREGRQAPTFKMAAVNSARK